MSSKSSSPPMAWVRAVVAAVAEQAVDVALVGDVDHRVDSGGEQLGVGGHVGAVPGGLVEDPGHLGDGFVVGPAAGADQVEQVLDLGVVGDDVALVVEVDQVVGVQPVAAVDAASSALMLRSANITPGMQSLVGVGGHDGVQALGGGGQVAVLLHVVEQVHAEVVEAQIGDRDAGADVLQFDDLVLQLAQLLPAERGVAGLLGEDVVVGGARRGRRSPCGSRPAP